MGLATADREFKKAIELDNNYTLAPHWYGLFLAEMGRFDEAVASEKRALEIEPFHRRLTPGARVLFYARRYNEAVEQYRKTIRLNHAYRGFYAELTELYQADGMWKEWYELNQKTGIFNPQLKKAFQTGGIKGYWQKWVELSSKSKTLDWDYYFSPACRCVKSDEKNEAFKFLNKSFEFRDHRMAQLKVSPKFDNLRSDPRFAELLQRMNLNY